MGPTAFKDQDALAFANEGEEGGHNSTAYVGKRSKRKSKGLEVVFDPEEHR